VSNFGLLIIIIIVGVVTFFICFTWWSEKRFFLTRRYFKGKPTFFTFCYFFRAQYKNYDFLAGQVRYDPFVSVVAVTLLKRNNFILKVYGYKPCGVSLWPFSYNLDLFRRLVLPNYKKLDPTSIGYSDKFSIFTNNIQLAQKYLSSNEVKVALANFLINPPQQKDLSVGCGFFIGNDTVTLLRMTAKPYQDFCPKVIEDSLARLEYFVSYIEQNQASI
jgi:hypothetical protein